MAAQHRPGPGRRTSGSSGMMSPVRSPDVRLLFDDISVGTMMTVSEAYEITADEIVEVSRRWDPQPFHLDPVSAAASHFGGLVASGLHTIAASLALGSRETPGTAAMAGLGLDDLRVLHPVRPGNRRVQTPGVVEARPSPSRADPATPRWPRRATEQEGVAGPRYAST